MADRMARMWAPVRTSIDTLAAGAVMRIDMLSILEVALGRDFRQWTVTRIVGNLQVASSATEFVWGVRVENENVLLGSVDPLEDATADWILHGGLYTNTSAVYPRDIVKIDNRSQRKSHGEQSKLFFYIQNTGGAGGQVGFIGRALMLIP